MRRCWPPSGPTSRARPGPARATARSYVDGLGTPTPRACQFLSSVWLLDPVHRGGHAEHPHGGARRFLVAGGDSAPLFEPRPETLDPIAVVVDPWGTGDVGFVALGRDRRAGAKVPDEVTEGVAGIAAIGHDPGGDEGEEGQEQRRQRQLVRLPGGQGEAEGATGGIGDHARLARITTARPTERLAHVALC